jgi:hypothetical protein
LLNIGLFSGSNRPYFPQHGQYKVRALLPWQLFSEKDFIRGQTVSVIETQASHSEVSIVFVV